jgi:putative ABC transporter-associated repeat protein
VGYASGARLRFALTSVALGLTFVVVAPVAAHADANPVVVAPDATTAPTSPAPEVAPAEPATEEAPPADGDPGPPVEESLAAEDAHADGADAPGEAASGTVSDESRAQLPFAEQSLALEQFPSSFASRGTADGVRPYALTTGHIDLFEVTYDAGIEGLRLSTKDDTNLYAIGAQYRDPTEVALYIDSDDARTDVSGLPAGYAFLKDAASTVYLLPQTQSQKPALPWPGWSTERLHDTLPQDIVLAAGSPVSLDVSIDGPGEVFTWQTGNFGAVQNRFIDTANPAADTIPIAANAHVHTNWAFTALGDYAITVTPRAVTTTGATITGPPVVYLVHVGPPADAAPQATAAPAISGDAIVGGALALDDGAWTPRPHALTIEWLRDGEPISGATGTGYTAVEADAGHRIAARVTARVGTASTAVITTPVEIPRGGAERWDVPNWSPTASGARILNLGHIDVASLIEGGSLVTRIKDTTEEGLIAGDGSASWHRPEDVVLQAFPESAVAVPDSPAFSFLGEEGDTVWMLPQIQAAGLLWPGWSTEHIPAGTLQGGVDWTLAGVDGPGEVAVFEGDGFGVPTVFFDSSDGYPDTMTIGAHVHQHGSWAFGAEGVYCLAFERSATLASGAEVTDDFTLAVAVGDVDVRSVDPADCGADDARPGDDDTDSTPIDELDPVDEVQAGGADAADGIHAGDTVVLPLGAEAGDRWVSVWLNSQPRWLGWMKTASDGRLSVTLPTDAPNGDHHLVVEGRDGTVLAWAAFTVVPATPEQPGGEQPAANPTTPRSQCVGGATILSAGHIDYSSRIVNGKLESYIGDDTGGSKVYREPANVVMWLKPSSAVTLPGGMGAVGPAGSRVWQVPQTQVSDLIWLGWSTEALNAGNTSGAVTWSLDRVSGPGSVKVYTAGSFGGVSMVLDGASSTSVPLGVHAHANWAFSAQGVYRLTFTQSVTLAGGARSSDTETVTIAVGDVDPASAARGGGCGVVAASLLTGDKASVDELAEADQADDTSTGSIRGKGSASDAAEVTNPITALQAGNPVPLLLTVLASLLLLGLIGGGGLWFRARRRA